MNSQFGKSIALKSTVILMVLAKTTFAQEKKITSSTQLWIGYFNQTRLSDKWGIWTNFHLRTKRDFFNDFSQLILRSGITYYINDATKVTAGYAFVNHFPSDNHKNISQPEHRPWQQVQWHNKYGRIRTMQWFRLEERFRRKILNDSTLARGNHFNWRLRYNFFLLVPITKPEVSKGTISFVLNDEVHVNFGKQILYNHFDQNRFFIGFSYQTNANDNLQVGYMNQYQQLAAGDQFKSNHVARIFYFHNPDLRKKNKHKQ